MAKTTTEPPILLTRNEAAEYLTVRPSTLATWACNGRYPLPVVRLGTRAVRYRKADLDRFIESRVSDHGRNDNTRGA